MNDLSFNECLRVNFPSVIINNNFVNDAGPNRSVKLYRIVMIYFLIIIIIIIIVVVVVGL